MDQRVIQQKLYVPPKGNKISQRQMHTEKYLSYFAGP